MPLPSVSLFSAPQCQCLCKRTKKPCQNPAAFGMRACRMHGAHRPHTALSGDKHPNYQHGECTNEARDAYRKASAKLRNLETIGYTIGMFIGPRWPGRKPQV
jgi:hypothetical protein